MTVVGITGHQNIPEKALPFIREEVIQILSRFGRDFIGVSSLAEGADQLFAETVIRLGGSLHAVIPCHEYEESFGTNSAVMSFRKYLKMAESVETLSYEKPSETAFLEAGKRVVDLSDILVAVWDGKGSLGKGGTADVVSYARHQGTDVVIIWPHDVTR